MTGRLVIAGTSSNVGKTTIASGLLAAARRRGLVVRPYKAGPDYLDPTYHSLAARQPGRNLDTWLVPHDRLRSQFAASLDGADLAIIEGVMGLYDGADYLGESGSTAELAKLLDAPTILVIDVRAQARSAAATVLGFARLDPAVRIAGVICNRVGGTSHYAGVKAAIEATVGLPVLGGLPQLPGGAIPERHLGLVSASEGTGRTAALIDTLAAAITEHCDLDALLRIAASAPPMTASAQAETVYQPRRKPTIAYAHDAAFSFYYTENLEALRACGADLLPFSPLSDTALPTGIDAIYLGGGYPELHAAQLASNGSMRTSMRTALVGDLPCYAECGGLMYLTESLTDTQGICHPMVGTLPGRAVMRTRRSHLGYATVRALIDTPLLKRGEATRAHEFHYSDWLDIPPDAPRAYAATARRDGMTRDEGFARGNLLASYTHLHFWSEPTLARNFVAAAATFRAHRESHDGR